MKYTCQLTCISCLFINCGACIVFQTAGLPASVGPFWVAAALGSLGAYPPPLLRLESSCWLSAPLSSPGAPRHREAGGLRVLGLSLLIPGKSQRMNREIKYKPDDYCVGGKCIHPIRGRYRSDAGSQPCGGG